MRRRFPVSVVLLLLGVILAGAAAPPELLLTRKKISSGGKETRENNVRILHTIGETTRGRSEKNGLIVRHGFWKKNKAGQATDAPETIPGRPLNSRLDQNHPNPFNPRTTIRYALANEGHVKLSLYDVRGRRVAVLVDGNQDAGVHDFVFDAKDLASGVYLYRLVAPDFQQVRRLVLAR